jgi:enoyl-CoA hydratase/carnithine racemase
VELERVTYGLARTIASNAPLSLAGMKAVVQRAVALREPIDHDDLDAAARAARVSADAREGVAAMLEKRPPRFRGE